MRVVGWAAVSLCALAACGSGSNGRDAAAGGDGSGGVVSAGRGGAAGAIGGASGGGAAGIGGAAGAVAGVGGAGRGGTAGGNAGRGGGAGGNAGTGGTSDAGGPPDAGADGGLPACEISSRPADPTNAGADGGLITSSSGKCNSIVLAGPWINRGCFDRQGDGGVADGGFIEGPAGGTIGDGDYDLVSADGSLSVGQCPADYNIGTTRRRMRVFGGGTYIEWGAVNRNTSDVDTNVWYDTTMRAAGHTLTFVSYDCGDTYMLKSYGYTARDDDFTYFAYSGDADGSGYLQTIVRYRRTCRR